MNKPRPHVNYLVSYGQNLRVEEIDPNGVTLYFQSPGQIKSLMSFINDEIAMHGYLTIDRLAEELEIILAQTVKRDYKNAVIGYKEIIHENDVIESYKAPNGWEYNYKLTLPKGKPLVDMDIHIIDPSIKVKEVKE
jgi:hypothetical protein